MNFFPEVKHFNPKRLLVGKLLSISIPSYNRSRYLIDLLSCIKRECDNDKDLLESVSIYVYDNASSDETCKVVENSGLPIIYQKNVETIAGDRNMFQAYIRPYSRYVWVIGDDELLQSGAIRHIVDYLTAESPALLLLQDNDPQKIEGYRTQKSFIFPSYRDYVSYILKLDPLLLNHTLISSNVIRMDLFDKVAAFEKLGHSPYAHVHGLLNNLIKSRYKIIMSREQLLIIRQEDRHPPFENTPQARKMSPKEKWTVCSGMVTSMIEILTWILKENTNLKNPYRIACCLPKRAERKVFIQRWRQYSFLKLARESCFFMYYWLYEIDFLRNYVFEPIKRRTGIRRRR